MLRHLAVIMDGNGRWAERRHLPRSAGHKMGAEAAKRIIELCPKYNIQYLTLYTFSAENWSRPEDEVSDLMNLLRFYLNKELKALHENNVRLKMLGDHTRLPADVRTKIEEAESLTLNNNGLFLNIALSYGGRQEIVRAVTTLLQTIESGEIATSSITEDILSNHLYTNGIPDPDLLVRTGGEHRLSNFLLWQMAYTEFYFTDVLWPDFNEAQLQHAIEDFTQRERRFGMTPSPETNLQPPQKKVI